MSRARSRWRIWGGFGARGGGHHGPPRKARKYIAVTPVSARARALGPVHGSLASVDRVRGRTYAGDARERRDASRAAGMRCAAASSDNEAHVSPGPASQGARVKCI